MEDDLNALAINQIYNQGSLLKIKEPNQDPCVDTAPKTMPSAYQDHTSLLHGRS